MSRPSPSTLVLIATLAAALSLARHLPFADDPFVSGMAAMIGACYEGRIQQNFEVDGLLAMGGRP